jgi:hypothetical protein
VHDHGLIFSRSGYRSRLYRVSPFLFGDYSALDYNKYFLPEGRELPEHGLTAQVLTFDFGFATPSLQIGAQDSQYFPITLGGNFLALWIAGTSDVPPSQATVPGVALVAPTVFPTGVQTDPQYLVTFQQTHEGTTWQWMNKAISNREVAGGNNGYPFMFKRPVLIPEGDTLGCTVQNMANASLRVQLMIMGAAF